MAESNEKKDSGSGGNNKPGGKRRYFRRRRRRSGGKNNRDEGSDSSTKDGAPDQSSDKSQGSDEGRQKKRRTNRRRSARRRGGNQRQNRQPAPVVEESDSYQEPTAVYIYSHIVRPAYREISSDYVPEHSFQFNRSSEISEPGMDLLTRDINKQLDVRFADPPDRTASPDEGSEESHAEPTEE